MHRLNRVVYAPKWGMEEEDDISVLGSIAKVSKQDIVCLALGYFLVSLLPTTTNNPLTH